MPDENRFDVERSDAITPMNLAKSRATHFRKSVLPPDHDCDADRNRSELFAEGAGCQTRGRPKRFRKMTLVEIAELRGDVGNG